MPRYTIAFRLPVQTFLEGNVEIDVTDAVQSLNETTTPAAIILLLPFAVRNTPQLANGSQVAINVSAQLGNYSTPQAGKESPRRCVRLTVVLFF